MDFSNIEKRAQEIYEKFQKEPPKQVEIADDADLSKYCDHTVLRVFTKPEMVVEFCKEAIELKTKSVCVNSCHARLVSESLKGSDVLTCCTIGFPNGATSTAVKAYETALAVKDGAQEIDMVINIGYLRAGDYKYVYDDIKAVVDACGDKAILKVIIETCYLTDIEKIIACMLSLEAGAKFVKTCTGTGIKGVFAYDILLMRAAVEDKIPVKASGGITTRAKALEMLRAGAQRMGVDRTAQILKNDDTIITPRVRNDAQFGI